MGRYADLQNHLFGNCALSPMKTRRPLAITVLCILMVVGTLGVLIQDLPRAHFAASWMPFYLACSAVVTLASAVGMWKMKKWSVHTYAGWAALSTVVGIAMLGMFNLTALVVRVVVVAVSFYFICGRDGGHAEPGAAPNGGPAAQLGNSGVTEGPPSVS